MLNRPVDDLKDISIRAHIEHLQAEAQGNTIILSAAPTASAPLLQDKEVGQHSTNLYWRVGNTVYRIATDAQITIT